MKISYTFVITLYTKLFVKYNTANVKSTEPNQKSIITAELIAEVVQCAPVTVRMILNGTRSQKTKLGRNIIHAKVLLETGVSKLVEDVKSSL